MKRLGRVGLITLALAAVYLALNGIGWAAVFFWKSASVVRCVAVPSFILCPLSAVEVVPGSPLDTPLFFIPLTSTCLILWAWGIEKLWNKERKQSGPSDPPAPRPPSDQGAGSR
jgi:hypothetical protein